MHPTRGIAAATCSYTIWGLLPVYWKSLEAYPAIEILCHRMTWSLVVTFGLLFLFRRWRNLRAHLSDRSVLAGFACSSILLGTNWLIYIWAVNSGHIIETSLGYFINPLVTVAFGVLFLQERLRPGQRAALALAFAGVAYLTFVYGRFPWIALVLAMTFAVYGLLHKRTKVAPLEGLGLETLVFFLPAAAFLLYLEFKGSGSFGHARLADSLLLAGTGVVTTIPLLLFAYAAHNIPLSLLGLLQYTSPTLNLLLGIFVYGESFPTTRMIGFLLVWSGLAVYLFEGAVIRARRKRAILQV